MITIVDATALDDYLQELNETGITPVAAGRDAKDIAFLAYGWAPGGDGWAVNILRDDPFSQEFETVGISRYEECHAEERLPVSLLYFPVRVI